jgi:hypothetical protein
VHQWRSAIESFNHHGWQAVIVISLIGDLTTIIVISLIGTLLHQAGCTKVSGSMQ